MSNAEQAQAGGSDIGLMHTPVAVGGTCANASCCAALVAAVPDEFELDPDGQTRCARIRPAW